MVIRSLAVLLMLATPALAQPQPQTKPAAPVYPMPPPQPVISPYDGHRPGAAFTDRATLCLQYGTSIGVPADRMDKYVRDCVKSP